MPACVFCGIVNGSPAHRVLDTDAACAFLDNRPLFPGHVLVVPRAHVQTLGDLPAEAVGPFFLEVKRIARAVERGLDAEGTFVAMNNKISQSVPHLHVHVVPRKSKDGLRGFFWPRAKYASVAEADDVALRIREALERDLEA